MNNIYKIKDYEVVTDFKLLSRLEQEYVYTFIEEGYKKAFFNHDISDERYIELLEVLFKLKCIMKRTNNE